MTRRGFLGTLGAALVGSCVATKIPTAWLPAPVQRWAACEYLLRHYREWTDTHDQQLGGMIVGCDLWEAYAEQLSMPWRFTSTRDPGSLLFKCHPLIARGSGWNVRMLDDAEWERVRLSLS